MTMTISIPDRLIPQISEAAKNQGFHNPADFVTHLIEEKLLELEEKRKFFESSDRVRAALEAQGISEEEILADFEKFRERLYREQAEGNHRS